MCKLMIKLSKFSMNQNPLFESKNVTASEFIHFDDHIDSHEIILDETQEDISQEMLIEHQTANEEPEFMDIDTEIEKVSSVADKEALECVEKLLKWSECCNLSVYSTMSSIMVRINAYISEKFIKQTSVDQYFS